MKIPSILIVEDQVVLQELYKEILIDSGYSCEIAASVKEAIEKLQKSSFNIAMLDMKLYSENHGGLKILQWLIDNEINIKVIICTAYDTLEIRRKATISDKVIAFITKIDFSPELLISVINKATSKY